MQRAVDGHNVALRQHLFQILNTSTSNLLLQFWLEGLVVEIQQLLAIEGFQSPQNTFADAANSHGTDDFAFEIVLALGDGGNVPVPFCDLLVGGDEVADKNENGHDDVFCDRNDIGAGNFGDGDAAVSFVGCVEVDMVGADTGSDGKFEVLGFGETFGGEVAGVEARNSNISRDSCVLRRDDIEVVDKNVRSGYDDFSIDQFLVEGGVLALLIRSRHQGVTLVLEPFANTEFVLSGPE